MKHVTETMKAHLTKAGARKRQRYIFSGESSQILAKDHIDKRILWRYKSLEAKHVEDCQLQNSHALYPFVGRCGGPQLTTATCFCPYTERTISEQFHH